MRGRNVRWISLPTTWGLALMIRTASKPLDSRNVMRLRMACSLAVRIRGYRFAVVFNSNPRCAKTAAFFCSVCGRRQSNVGALAMTCGRRCSPINAFTECKRMSSTSGRKLSKLGYRSITFLMSMLCLLLAESWIPDSTRMIWFSPNENRWIPEMNRWKRWEITGEK